MQQKRPTRNTSFFHLDDEDERTEGVGASINSVNLIVTCQQMIVKVTVKILKAEMIFMYELVKLLRWIFL